jgi:hypothetical protein
MSQTKLDASPKWDNQVANQPSQMDHPMDFLEQNTGCPGLNTIVPGSPYEKIPIRLNPNEK